MTADHVVNQPHLINDPIDLNRLKAMRDSGDIEGLFQWCFGELMRRDTRVTSADTKHLDPIPTQAAIPGIPSE